MAFLLNFFTHLSAAAALAQPPARLTELSETERFARHPVLAACGAALFVVGLVADAYLVARWRRVGSGQTAATGPLLKIEPKPWNLHDLALATATLVLVVLGGDLLVAAAARVAHLDPATDTLLALEGESILRVGLLVGFGFYLRRLRLSWSEAFGLNPPSKLRATAAGVVYYLALLPLLGLVVGVNNVVCRAFGVEQSQPPIANLLINTDSAWTVGLIVGFAIIVAPVFEEIFFRGYAYPALKQCVGTWRALVYVSAAFALVHLHLPSTLPLFALAIGLGLAYELTGSLLAPLAMHALFNATNVAMLLYLRAHR